MDVCTVIAKNYAAHARVLARSFAAHHPKGRFYVLVIDEPAGYLGPEEPFTILSASDVGVERFETMSALYNVLELATAVKPWLLRWVAAHSEDNAAVYLDPDMRIYAPLHDLFARVHEHELVLSPHNLGPMPRDGRRPSEQDILVAGAYNLGFIGVKAGQFADDFLDWWGERLETDCVVDPGRGFFVDQRWIDLVPGMAPNFHLLRDPGFNVAYWNLHSRPVSRTPEGEWMAADAPLRLFHFSGFDHDHPTVLSKHQTRVRVQDHPDLARLCLDYAQELRAEGVERALTWPYDYVTTANGLELTPDIRRAYRELLVEGRFDASIFTPEGEAELLEALNAPAGSRSGGKFGVTRFLASLHAHHAHISRAFPDLANVDGPRLVEWAHRHSRGEVPEALLPPTLPTAAQVAPVPPAPSAPPEGTRPFGVNVAGYLNAELGVGEVARQTITALDTAGVPVLPMALAAPGSRHNHPFAHTGLWSGGYPINLVCVNADALPGFADQVGPAFFEGRHTIGWWWWELAQFPEQWLDSFEHVDQLWAGSTFVGETLSTVAKVPVTVVPAPVTVEGAPRSEPGRFGLPLGFSFLFSYDYSSVLRRKNPLGVIEAFLRAFPEPGEASLVLKSINAEHHPADHGCVKDACKGHRHILVFDDYLHPSDKDRLVASCDCYVSLHRSEGFGMTLAEAMYLGKPVIATGYSGNVDFMKPDNSWLVDYQPVAVGPGAAPYPPEARWAEPDLAHAASLMREVVEGGEAVRQRAHKGARDIRRSHSPEATGRQMEKLLRDAATYLPHPRGGWEDPPARTSSRAAAGLLESGAQAAPTPGRRWPRRALRDLVLRLIKPHTAHQAQIDQKLIDALEHVSNAVRVMNERNFAMEALTLQGLRRTERRLRGELGADLEHNANRLEDNANRLAALTQRLELGPLEAPATYPPAPREPWSHEYNAAHAAFVSRALEDSQLLAKLANGGGLPQRWGAGFDERVVELPWLASQQPGGTVLDAGSTLNHDHILQRLRPAMDKLHIVTLAPEDRAFPQLDVSYLFADLRELPLGDDVYDQVVSISTLEHLGMDLGHFGASSEPVSDPQGACLDAVDELRRVLRPGGTVFLTVPVGRPERFEWVRTLGLGELDAVIERFEPVNAIANYFRHDRGWQRVDRDAVADARYRDHLSGAEPRGNGVVAAEAIACVAVTVSG